MYIKIPTYQVSKPNKRISLVTNRKDTKRYID